MDRVARSTRTWIIGQLGIIVKSPACSESVAVTILHFLATVAYAQAGAKAKKSKVGHVKGLGSCLVPLSDEIRGLAASRTAAIATDALPCTREADGAERGAAEGAADEAVVPAQATGKQTSKKHKALTCLLPKVLEYLDSLEALPESTVSLLEPDGISEGVKKQLSTMMAACDTARSRGKQDAAGAHMHVLLGMLRLALCTSAAHDVAEIIVDLYPAVGPTLGVELPQVEGGGGSDADEDIADADVEGRERQDSGWVNQLTECLLSLLSDSLGHVPMAVMRMAVEGVWRAAAPHVNAVALSDLLQVLLRLDQKAVAEESMFEGEDEAEEEEEEEESDEEDEDDMDEEQEEGPAGGAREGKGAGAALANGNGEEKGGAGEEGEEAESEDEGLDDAAMFRLDKQLAKYFSSIKGGKEGVKARNEALRKFQLRVLTLVEIWAKKQSDSPLVALVPVPLLRALRIAGRPSGHPPLAQRLEHVLRTQVARCRPAFPVSLEVDGLAAPSEAAEGGKMGRTGLEQVIARVMYFATREADSKLQGAANAAYIMLLRGVISAARGAPAEDGAADSTPAATAMHAAVAVIVQDVFEKRQTRWSYENVSGLLKMVQDVLPVLLLPALLQHVTAGRTEFLRIEALRLCGLCLRYAPRQVEEFKALKMEGKMVKAVTEAVAAGYTSTGRRLGGLQACADALEGLCRLHGGAAMKDICSEKRLNALQAAIKQVEGIDDLPPKCKTQLQRVKKVLDGSRGGGGAGRRKRKRQGGGTGGNLSANANEKENSQSKKAKKMAKS
eukprot:jgi/Ulvmu1/10039/UM059_0089.1